MRTRWEGGSEVVAPLSLIVSAFAPVDDVRRTLTPQLRPTRADAPAAGRSRRGRIAWAAAPWRRCMASSATRRPTSDDPAARGRSSTAMAGARARGPRAGLPRPLRRRPARHVAGDGLRRPLGSTSICRRRRRRPRSSPRSSAPCSRCARPIFRRWTAALAATGLRGRRTIGDGASGAIAVHGGSSWTSRGRHPASRSGPRRATACSGCATTRRAPTRSTRRCDADDPGLCRAAHVRPGRRRRRAVIATRRPRGGGAARAGRERPDRDGGGLRACRLRSVDVHMTTCSPGA
jgi:hypothetical protein